MLQTSNKEKIKKLSSFDVTVLGSIIPPIIPCICVTNIIYYILNTMYTQLQHDVNLNNKAPDCQISSHRFVKKKKIFSIPNNLFLATLATFP